MPTGYSNLTGQNPFKGKKRKQFSKKHRLKISKAQVGRIPWNKGKKGLQKMSAATRKKMSDARKNEKHWAWRGQKVSYYGLHSWVKINWGPARFGKCEHCSCSNKTRKLNWANLDHKYSRVKSMWAILCVKCHYHYDAKKFKNRHGYKQKK